MTVAGNTSNYTTGEIVLEPLPPAPAAIALPTERYVGDYFLDGDEGAPCSITKSGDTFLFANEQPQSVRGTIIRNVIQVVGWPVTGTLNDGFILWSNYSLWTKAKVKREDVESAIIGDWKINGKPTKIFKRGDQIIAQNEYQQRTVLQVRTHPLDWQANNWGRLTALISPDVKTIFWGNNTTTLIDDFWSS
jgi:hypothetical protein